MQSRAVAAARSVCARAPGVGVGGGRARTSRRGAATRSANAKNAPAAADDAGDVASQAILKPRARGKHLDRPWHLTYLRNQGHGTPAQKAALRELWSTYGVDVQTYGGPAGDDVGSAVSDEEKEDAAKKKKKASASARLPRWISPRSSPSSRPMPPRRWRSDSGWGTRSWRWPPSSRANGF